MSFNFFLNSSFIVLFSLLSSVSILSSPLYYAKIKNLCLLFSLALPFVGFFRPLDIADISNLTIELSGLATSASKYGLIRPLLSLDILPEIKLTILSIISSLIVSLCVLIRLRRNHFHCLSVLMLYFSLYPLMHFHYRQYLAFSLSCLFYTFFFANFKLPRLTNFLICSIIIVLIYFCHVVYLLPIVMLLIFNIVKIRSQLVVSLSSYRLFRASYISFFAVTLLLYAILFFSQVQEVSRFIVPLAYQSYISWGTNQGISLYSLLLKSLFFLPFIFLAFSSSLSYEYNPQKTYLDLRSLIFCSILTIFAILLCSLFYKLYSFERLASGFYPLLIFIPISHFSKFKYMRIVASSLFFLTALHIMIKSSSYHLLSIV